MYSILKLKYSTNPKTEANEWLKKEIQCAYTVLSNRESKAKYDKTGIFSFEGVSHLGGVFSRTRHLQELEKRQKNLKQQPNQQVPVRLITRRVQSTTCLIVVLRTVMLPLLNLAPHKRKKNLLDKLLNSTLILKITIPMLILQTMNYFHYAKKC